MILKEINRERYGGSDGRAINKHSSRIYETSDGQLVVLDRTLDMAPPAFEITGPYAKDFQGVTPITKVNGERFFCDGQSWNKAIKVMCETLKATVQPRNTN